ncbi:hypothetical protein [Nocardia sp. NPDC004711]
MTTVHEPVGYTARLNELDAIKRAAHLGPDPAATQRQHGKGKLTARERIDLLLGSVSKF